MTQLALQEKFTAVEDDLNKVLIERVDEIHSAILCILARRHLFMVGPPGVAKSLLVDELVRRIEDAVKFKWLLTKFSVPEELFGGPDLLTLKNSGVYRRITDGKLPKAHIGWIDEALALDTPIITPQGWRTIGDLQIGDTVYGADGQPTRIVNLTPVFLNHDCYRVTFRDDTSVVADAGHKWLSKRAYSTQNPAWKVRTTAELAELGTVHIPRGQAIEFPARDVELEPYLMGLWLGNGNNTNGEIYVRDEFLEDTLKEIQVFHPDAYVRGWTSEHVAAVSMAGYDMRAKLRTYGAVSNKYLPEDYIFNSRDARIELVRGLMDTDGYLNEKGTTCIFSNTNESVVDGLIVVLRSLGVLATKKLKKDDRVGANGPHKQCWQVIFSPDFHPFRGRKVVMAERQRYFHQMVTAVEPVPSVPVRCIEVEAQDHLFLVGEGMVPTHNCFKANSAILNSLLKILNEGQFDNPGDDPHVPLITLFAASNEIGNTAELEALADRLHMWHHVQPIRENSNFVRMLQGSESEPEAYISLEDIYKAQAEIQHVILGDDIMGALLELRTTLANEEIRVTDRRFHQTLAVIRAQAWLDGREVADIGDVIPLQHMLWRQLEHLPKVRDAVYDLADPVEKEAIRVREEWEAAYQSFKDATQANEMAGRRSTATLEIMRKYRGARKEVKKLKDARKHTSRKCRPLMDLERRLKELGPEILQEGFQLSEDDVQAMAERGKE